MINLPSWSWLLDKASHCRARCAYWLALTVICVLALLAPAGPADNLKIRGPDKHIRTLHDLLNRALDLQLPALTGVKQAVNQGNEAAAWDALLQHFRQRQSPVDPQVVHWNQIDDKRFVEFWSKDAKEFPQRYSKGDRINWRNGNNPPRREYESFEIRNRLINLAGWTAAANLSNSATLRQAVVATFLDWYRDCPAPELPVSGWWDGHKTGFAWQEIEVALRGRMLISIFFASLHWPEAAPEFHQALLLSIHQSMDFLVSQYARFGFRPHNHQNIHGMTLVAGGVLLPEMKSAAVWKELGMHLLRKHAQTDFHQDGVQVENSPHYHAKVFFVFLDAYEVLRAGGSPVDSLAWLEKHLHKTADFLLYSCDASGRHLPINDGWYTSDLALLRRSSAVLGRADLLALETAMANQHLPPTSRAFLDAGIALMRSSWQADAVVVGLDASSQHSGHWHCGKPNLLIHAGDQPLLCNPQMSNYDDPWHWQYFKRAEAHNTVLVDGQGDAEPSGPWSYRRISKPRITAFRSSQLVDIACATTDGFQQLKPPVTFERTLVFIKPGTVFVHDVLRCEGKRRYEWLLHVPPQQPIVDEANKTFRTQMDGPYQLVAAPAPGPVKLTGPTIRQGKYHARLYEPQYGYWFPLQYGDVPAVLVDAPYAVWTQEGQGTVCFDFVLSIVRKGEQPVAVRRLDTKEALTVAYEIALPNGSASILLDERPGERAPLSAGGYTLSGRVGVGIAKEWLSVP